MKKLLTAIVPVFAIATACGGGGGNSIESFCGKAADAQSVFSQLGDTASDSERGISLFEDLTKNAPNEIKTDMATILSFLKNSANSDSPSTDSVTNASKRVVQFFKDKCHVDLEAGAGGSSSFSSVASSISN